LSNSGNPCFIVALDNGRCCQDLFICLFICDLKTRAFSGIERAWKAKNIDCFEAIPRQSGIGLERVEKVTKILCQHSQFTSGGWKKGHSKQEAKMTSTLYLMFQQIYKAMFCDEEELLSRF
jgi:hypothetical protein